MSKEVYKQLFEVMKGRGGSYAGAEIPEFYKMVEVMFTPEEAEVNNAMLPGQFTAETLAKKMGRDEGEITDILEGMANNGLCMAMKMEDTQYYMAAPFMPGIFEFLLMRGTKTDKDIQLARLMYDYKKAFEASEGLPDVKFPPIRVITVDSTVEPGSTVHTYDQVETLINNADPISVVTCFCRHSADLRGEDLHGMPKDVCMALGPMAQFQIERLGARKLNKEEAMGVLNRSEEAGLVHMCQNTEEGVGFV
ncbi:MAG: hypothetical protein HOD17_00140 [Desulfobacteraceae bacterium]|jgi:hypothetical protein|nr:hypothetical protein [Desulfobacteraceae bacterium]